MRIRGSVKGFTDITFGNPDTKLSEHLGAAAEDLSHLVVAFGGLSRMASLLAEGKLPQPRSRLDHMVHVATKIVGVLETAALIKGAVHNLTGVEETENGAEGDSKELVFAQSLDDLAQSHMTDQDPAAAESYDFQSSNVGDII